MKMIQINLYEYSELSEEAKEKAIQNLWDINVDHEWWEFTLEDAGRIGLKITEFEIERGIYGEFTLSAEEVAANILKEHGDSCDTYKCAETFLNLWEPKFAEYFEKEGIELEEELMEIEEQFLKDLCYCYLRMLDKEYEYLTSEKAIIEAIEANEYHFTEDGKLS